MNKLMFPIEYKSSKHSHIESISFVFLHLIYIRPEAGVKVGKEVLEEDFDDAEEKEETMKTTEIEMLVTVGRMKGVGKLGKY